MLAGGSGRPHTLLRNLTGSISPYGIMIIGDTATMATGIIADTGRAVHITDGATDGADRSIRPWQCNDADSAETAKRVDFKLQPAAADSWWRPMRKGGAAHGYP